MDIGGGDITTDITGIITEDIEESTATVPVDGVTKSLMDKKHLGHMLEVKKYTGKA